MSLGNDTIRCEHCGHEGDIDDFDVCGLNKSDEWGKLICNQCGKLTENEQSKDRPNQLELFPP